MSTGSAKALGEAGVAHRAFFDEVDFAAGNPLELGLESEERSDAPGRVRPEVDEDIQVSGGVIEAICRGGTEGP